MSTDSEKQDVRDPQPTPDVNHVLRTLDAEIDQLQADQKNSGWTTWGLLAAIGAMLWLLSGELRERVIAIHVAKLFIFGSLVLDLVLPAQSLLEYPSSVAHERRLRPVSTVVLLAGSRAEICIILLRAVALILVTAWAWADTALKFRGLIYTFYFLAILLALLVLALSWLKIPTSVGGPVRHWTITVPLLLLVLVPTLELGQELFLRRLLFSVHDYRAAGLITVLILLVGLLPRVARRSPLLELLIEVRRELGFHNVDVTTAIRRADIILRGERSAEVIGEHVQGLFDSIRRIEQEYDAAAKEVAVLLQRPGGITRQEIASWSRGKRIGELLTSLKNELNASVRRTRWILAADPVAKREFNELMDKFLAEFRAVADKLDALRSQLETAVSKQPR